MCRILNLLFMLHLRSYLRMGAGWVIIVLLGDVCIIVLKMTIILGINNKAFRFQGNAIYNILPDVISRLSDPDVGIAEDSFQEIMRYVTSAHLHDVLLLMRQIV